MEIKDIENYFSSCQDYNDLDKDRIAEILSKAIRFNTTSYDDTSKMDALAFKGLHDYFELCFPLVHKFMNKTVINEWSLLYHWKGSNPSLKPALFMAHLDVVPVMYNTKESWVYPPFSGAIVDDFIWGRGSIDTKSQVIGELFAAEYLLEKGMIPKRDIYFAFGHDEEIMGSNGAYAIMNYLKEKKVELEFVMDEGGGFKMGDGFGAPNALLAFVDIFEKGYVDIAIEATSNGGHSSRPGKSTALGKVAKAISKIEDNQLSPQLNKVVWNMFNSLRPVIFEEPLKSYVENLEINHDNLANYLYKIDTLAPLVHTTTALTMINGSPAPNVLPQKVCSIINFRIAPQDTCESILKHCIDTSNDPNLMINISKGMNASKISEIDSIGYHAIKKATETFFKHVVVTPGLVTGGTDCRYFEEICDCCYRFRPYIDNMILGYTAHATNEHCYIPGLLQGIKIIIQVMQNTCF